MKKPPGLNWKRIIQRLKIRLSPDSFEMRFALRLSIVLTITCSIGQLLPITRSYWIPLNAFLLLQPSSEDSSYQMKTRPVGTLIGCIVEFLALPFLPDTGSQILFALVMISFMYCAAPGTWYQPIFSTCYALTLTSMTLNETTAIQLRLLYLCAAVLIVFIVNRFFFPIRRDKLFQYNLRSFHVIYEECMDYTKKIPPGFREKPAGASFDNALAYVFRAGTAVFSCPYGSGFGGGKACRAFFDRCRQKKSAAGLGSERADLFRKNAGVSKRGGFPRIPEIF